MSTVIENTLWVEKYRPKTIDEYVGNPEFIAKVRHWIEVQDVPNLILYSEKSGTGKTTLCKLIANALDADVMYINASSENGIDVVRDKINTFATSIGFSKWKILILDEFSQFSVAGQSGLNNLIESCSKTTRFLLTGNYIEKFLPSIVSRCTPFLIQSPPPKDIYTNISRILNVEGIKFDQTTLVKIIKQYYPDQRAMLKYCQENSYTGELVHSNHANVINDYCIKILNELQNSKDVKTSFANIRQIIADSRVRQFDDLFTYLYEHVDDFTVDGRKAQIILHIADYQQRSATVIDKEIQVAALIINILRDK